MPRLATAHDSDGLRSLAAVQDGVLSRAQLRTFGWRPCHVSAATDGGRWAAYGENAVVLHRGPLTTRQRRWIAVVNGGPLATLAGPTAAEELGLTGFESDLLHIVVPRGTWIPGRHPGVKIHESRRFTAEDRHPARVLPTVRIERAVVDAAAWSPNARRACAIPMAAVQQRLARVDRLRAELLTAGKVRHHRLLLAVLDDVEGGVRALSELDFLRLARRYGLPEPELQRRRRDATGRVRYLDARLRRPDGRVVNVEVDGAAHAGVVEAWSDAERDLAFLAQGEPTIRIPSPIQRIDPAGVARRIRAVLDAPL